MDGSRSSIEEVALRKESVDRNSRLLFAMFRLILSLSARRAWIEMGIGERDFFDFSGRSPQGERG